MMGGRTYKQCRERYTNYLKEGLNVGPWSKEEDRLLLSMHAKIGNKWAEIARHLKGECNYGFGLWARVLMWPAVHVVLDAYPRTCSRFPLFTSST